MENMKETKVTKQKNSGFITCVLCKNKIINNTINPLICICEENLFYHYECYEKSGEEVNIDKVIKDFEKARIKY